MRHIQRVTRRYCLPIETTSITAGLQATLMAGALVFLILTLAPFVFPAWRQLNTATAEEGNTCATGGRGYWIPTDAEIRST